MSRPRLKSSNSDSKFTPAKGNPSKSKPIDSKNLQDRRADILVDIKVKLRNSKVYITSLLVLILKSPRNAYHWLQLRPSAIREWISKDRKKKKYRSFHLQKRIRPEPRDIPSVKKLITSSLLFVWINKKKLLPVIIVHAVIYYLAIKTPTSILSIGEIRESVQNALGKGSLNTWNGTLATLGTVVGLNTTSASNASQQSISFIGMSLVYIWMIRQIHNKQNFKIRDVFYQSFTPLVPVLLLLVIAAVQIMPFAIAGLVYSIARTGGIFVTGFEDMAFFVVAILMALISFYLLTTTIMALYIVTIPGMYPMRAFDSAKQLIIFKRFTVFRRIIALPLVILALYFGSLLLVIRFAPSITLYFSEVISFLILPFLHTYLYKIYRSLL